MEPEEIDILPVDVVDGVREKALADVRGLVDSVVDMTMRAVHRALAADEIAVRPRMEEIDLDLLAEIVTSLAAGRAGKLHMATFGEEEAIAQIARFVSERKE